MKIMVTKIYYKHGSIPEIRLEAFDMEIDNIIEKLTALKEEISGIILFSFIIHF